MKLRHFIIFVSFLFFPKNLLIADSAITVYNQNFAVVRDMIMLELKNKGKNELQFSNITAHVEPASVMLREPTDKQSFQIIEQNYRADPISQNLLLSVFEGEEIEFIKEDTIIRGRIIRSAYVPHSSAFSRYGQQYYHRQVSMGHGASGQPIIEVEGKLRFGLPGIPLFPELANDTILKPTLHWIIETEKPGTFSAELCYITGGLNWEADYNIVAPEIGNIVDLIGWVTMDNQSGRTFENTRIKLMAGDVSKIQTQHPYYASELRNNFSAKTSTANVSEKAFDDYHLYTLQRSVTLRDRETKQVEFIHVKQIQTKRFYVYHGAKIDYQRYQNYSYENIRNQQDYGVQSNPKVWIMLEIHNDEENHLGIPLPKGRVRFYRQDGDGNLEFTGEDFIDHTPRNETIRAYTGNAFDLVGERRRTNFDIDHSRRWLDESFEIELRNHKSDKSVHVRVTENLYRWTNWKIVENTDPYTKINSQNIEFIVQVPANGEKTLMYKVHYSW